MADSMKIYIVYNISFNLALAPSPTASPMTFHLCTARDGLVLDHTYIEGVEIRGQIVENYDTKQDLFLTIHTLKG